MTYKEEGIRVGPSACGLGVFSLRSFTDGEELGPIPGEVMDDPDYGSDYGIEMGDKTLEPTAPFRFLNHSCQPNCELVVYEADEPESAGELSVWLQTLRAISPGEQLTIDYAWPADAAIPCLCGSANCRGWVVSSEGLSEVAASQKATA